MNKKLITENNKKISFWKRTKNGISKTYQKYKLGINITWLLLSVLSAAMYFAGFISNNSFLPAWLDLGLGLILFYPTIILIFYAPAFLREEQKNQEEWGKLVKKYNPKESKLFSIVVLSSLFILGIIGFILGRYIKNLPHVRGNGQKVFWLLTTFATIVIIYFVSIFLWLLRLKAKTLADMKKENDRLKNN